MPQNSTDMIPGEGGNSLKLAAFAVPHVSAEVGREAQWLFLHPSHNHMHSMSTLVARQCACIVHSTVAGNCVST